MIRFLFILMVAVLVSPVTKAQEILNFKPPADDYRDRIVLDYLAGRETAPAGGYQFARVDLNGDGVPEYIARPAKAFSTELIPFHILSLRRRQITDMGAIPARKLEISDKKSYGAREILVYNDPRNDYHREIWVQQETAYAPAAPGKR